MSINKRHSSEISVESGVSDSGYTEPSSAPSRVHNEPSSKPISIASSSTSPVVKNAIMDDSLPTSSPFSPPFLTKPGDQMVEYNSRTGLATIGHTPCEEEEELIVSQEPHDEQFELQEESQKGSSQPSAMSIPASTVFSGHIHGAMRSTQGSVSSDRATRICGAVSEYYVKQFVHHWKDKTRGCPGKNQESNTNTVVAALLIEKAGDFNVVVLTTGTKFKTACTFVRDDGEECSWGLCDGHAEAVCYRLASVYLLTEIYKIHKGVDSIFYLTDKGYKLKGGIQFHLFTSHPPCGFMGKRERHNLSWKKPFQGLPHNPQCSSKILINSYLGIQGPLSHLMVQPIYISSIVIIKYETIDTLHDDYIVKRLEAFEMKLVNVKHSSFINVDYHFCKPDVQIVAVRPNDLFPLCFTPYIQEKRTNKTFSEAEVPQEETTVKAKPPKQRCKKIGGAVPDVLGNAGIEALVFSIDQGIGSQADREKMIKLKGKLFRPSPDLKEQRLKALQEARERLCQALDVKEALEVQDKQIVEQMNNQFEKRCSTIDKTFNILKEFKVRKTDLNELTTQVDASKISLKEIKETHLSFLQTALAENLEYEQMHQDALLVQRRLEENPELYLDLMGCDWARYVETMCNEL